MSSNQDSSITMNEGTTPLHPGEILRQNYLAPLNLSVNTLASQLFVPASDVHEIVSGRKGITADTALRLARYFGGNALAWLELQMRYDLCCAQANVQELAKIAPAQPLSAMDMSAGAYRFCW